MNKTDTELLIIGAGLTGLALGFFLSKTKIDFKIIEARDRLGGRIFTDYHKDQASIEKGATWLGKQHLLLNKLLVDLNLEIFEQFTGEHAIYKASEMSPAQWVKLPPNDAPSYRIKGGTFVLIDALAKQLSPDQLHLEEAIQSITESGDHLVVRSEKKEYHAKHVISTLPPTLFVSSLKISPALPIQLLEIGKSTHTWMGESIKFGLRFKSPFWKRENNTPTLFSNVGIIPEMYEHNDFENSQFALKGFINNQYHTKTKEERQELVLIQLQKYYGREVLNFISYEELDWQNEKFTYAPYEHQVQAHQNNGHPIYQNAWMDGKLYLAGSETSSLYAGYMEGAIQSAGFIRDEILNKYNYT